MNSHPLIGIMVWSRSPLRRLLSARGTAPKITALPDIPGLCRVARRKAGASSRLAPLLDTAWNLDECRMPPAWRLTDVHPHSGRFKGHKSNSERLGPRRIFSIRNGCRGLLDLYWQSELRQVQVGSN